MKKSYAVITGASSGIGMAFARQLAAEGYRLVLVARREDRLQELAQELQKKGTESIVISADLSQKEACYHLMQQIEKLPVGILINDAGFGDCGSFLETDADKEMQMIDVNASCRAAYTARTDSGCWRMTTPPPLPSGREHRAPK